MADMREDPAACALCGGNSRDGHKADCPAQRFQDWAVAYGKKAEVET